MIKIEAFSKKHNLKIKKFLVTELKKVKKDSLIFSLSNNLMLEYFYFILKQGGHILLITSKKKIYGCLIFEKSSKNTISFLRKNSFAIIKCLILSKYLSDKIILTKLFFNWFFFQEKRNNYINNIIVIAVKKQIRGQNYGSKLIKILKKKIKKKIHVMTDKSNLNAQNFYIKNSFIKKREIKYGLRKLIVFCFNKNIHKKLNKKII